jgi:hypothetical protein
MTANALKRTRKKPVATYTDVPARHLLQELTTITEIGRDMVSVEYGASVLCTNCNIMTFGGRNIILVFTAAIKIKPLGYNTRIINIAPKQNIEQNILI